MEGKVVIVTGAASGLGTACAEHLAALGARVIAVDRQSGEPPAGGSWAELDLTDVAALESAVDEWASRYGRLDGLVNAAGVMDTEPYLTITPAAFDRVMDINFRAVFFLQQAVAAAIERQGGRGSIVNFSSTGGRVGRPLAAHYAASKAAVVSLTRSASVALGEHGIRVNVVSPGLVETPMLAGIRVARTMLGAESPEAVAREWEQRIPLGRIGTAADVASVVAFLISDASAYVTGEDIGIHGGLNGS